MSKEKKQPTEAETLVKLEKLLRNHSNEARLRMLSYALESAQRDGGAQ
jgi:hypothetical protein